MEEGGRGKKGGGGDGGVVDGGDVEVVVDWVRVRWGIYCDCWERRGEGGKGVSGGRILLE